ncbi:MAG: hypothetical protein ACYCW6_32065 [Candidatus Xenobia bacterium]
MQKVDNRLLIAFGFLGMGFSTYILGDVNLNITIASVAWPQVLNSLCVAFIFVPLTTTATATLPNQQMSNATCIYNLVRNIGVSVGI